MTSCPYSSYHNFIHPQKPIRTTLRSPGIEHFIHFSGIQSSAEKIPAWNVTKWSLFFNIAPPPPQSTHFFYRVCKSWIPSIKNVINSRYDVIILTFQPTLEYLFRYILDIHRYLLYRLRNTVLYVWMNKWLTYERGKHTSKIKVQIKWYGR